MMNDIFSNKMSHLWCFASVLYYVPDAYASGLECVTPMVLAEINV